MRLNLGNSSATPQLMVLITTGDTLLKGLFGQRFFNTITLAGLPTASNPHNTPPEPAGIHVHMQQNVENLHACCTRLHSCY